MTPEAKNIAVYCSSSKAVRSDFFDLAADLGERLGRRGDALIYGGTAVGLMGRLAEATRAAGGRVIGVLPRMMQERGLADEACDELIVCDGMRDRKAIMEERADAFIGLPGGFGTLEELMEVLTLKQLGYHNKAIVMINAEEFFTPLLRFFDHVYEHKFAKPATRGYFHVALDAADALRFIDEYKPAEIEPKWY